MPTLRKTLAVALLLLAPVAVSSAATTRLESALDVLSESRIRADVEFIASDELAGRDSPSLGLRLAARYLRARLAGTGWQPGARGGWFHEYELPMQQLDAAITGVAVRGGEWTIELEFGRDYFFSPFGFGDFEGEGEVVFCGSGQPETFESVRLERTWALCVDDGLERQETYRMMIQARKAKALGLILVPGASYAGEPYEEQYGQWARSALDGRLRRGASDAPVFPVLRLTSSAGRRLLGMASSRAEASLGGPVVGQSLGITLRDVRRFVEREAKLENVCGFWPGSDPRLADEAIVISAHYDHVGVGSGDEIYNGADDNGSGTSVLLAVAEALESYGPMRRSVLLLWVSAEEKGLLGSRAWTEDPWLPGGARAIANINIDMVGRNEPDKLLITPSRKRKEYNGLVRLAERLGPLEGFPRLGDPVAGQCDTYWTRSDHMNFHRNLKIPVTFLFSDVHEDYHQPGDTADKVDCDKVRRVARLVVRMLDELQADELDL